MIHRHGRSTRADDMPDSVKPMLAVSGHLPADSKDWAFEIKWDGVRAILFVEGGRVRAHSRNDLDITVSFPELADIGKFLGMTTCIIDGEIVALGADGRPSFSRLQQRMHVANQREAKRRSLSDPVTFVAFDLLYLDGHSLLDATVRRATGPTGVAASLRRDLHHDRLVPRRLRTGHPRRHRRERARRRRRQAPVFGLSTRSAQSRLDEGQVLPHAGSRPRRVDGGPRRAPGQSRRPPPRDPRRRWSALRRQGRDRLQRPRPS